MSDHYEHNPDDHEDPLTGPTWLLGVIGTALLIVIILGLAALYYSAQADSLDERVFQADFSEVKQLYDEQRRLLERSPQWIEIEADDDADDPESVLVIPIDHAMDLIVEEYGQR